MGVEQSKSSPIDEQLTELFLVETVLDAALEAMVPVVSTTIQPSAT